MRVMRRKRGGKVGRKRKEEGSMWRKIERNKEKERRKRRREEKGKEEKRKQRGKRNKRNYIPCKVRMYEHSMLPIQPCLKGSLG